MVRTAGVGPRRRVSGAHYGLGDWMAQRLTAVVLALFVLVLLASWLRAAPGYDGWAGIFAPLPMKVLTVIAVLAFSWHVWIGIRDIWMDYVQPLAIRLGLQILTVLWLLACAIWSVQILWSV